MKKTIAQMKIENMEGKGYTLVGSTLGQYTFRSGSNLAKLLTHLHLTQDQVRIVTGAKRQHKTEGYELLVFVKDE